MAYLSYDSDVSRLKSVLVHTPGKEVDKLLPLIPEENAALTLDYLGTRAQAEHAALVAILKQQGIQVLQLGEYVDAAISNAKQAGYWHQWLTSLPYAQLDLADEASITADDLMGASDNSYYHINPTTGRPSPLFSPQRMLFFCRDLAAMTPKGLVLCNFINKYRAPEPHLARLVLQNAEPLSALPIAFDAVKEGVYIQGGDLIVRDSETVLLGINNLTEKRTAKLLAQRLGMRVIAINMPPLINKPGNYYHNFTPLNLAMLHLDSVFSLVDHKTFVVVPYWFEQSKEGALLADMMYGLDPDNSVGQRMMADLAQVGVVTLYHPGSGKEEATNLKLVDFLKEEGYSPIYVGGEKLQSNPQKHIIERVLPELRFQASNVVALRPGEVIAYSGNQRHTLAALEGHGITVRSFESEALVRWQGGPHCLTLPIERTAG